MKTTKNLGRFTFYVWVGAVWLMLWIFNSLLSQSEIFLLQSLNEVWRVIYLVVVNYVFFEHGLPFVRKKRSSILLNVLIGVLLISIFFLFVSFGLYGWNNFGILLHIYTSLRHVTLIPEGPFNEIIEGALYEAQAGVASIFFFGLAHLFYANVTLRKVTQQLRIEKQEAELNYLKSQTNPHFLFNTLNNIYSLARDKSNLAPESILRLSKILRFMLYETSGASISIEQEVAIITDYIALEKLRYDESLTVSLVIEIDDMKQALPPLLLIPLVENAFKHGVSETRGHPFVDIHLSVRDQVLLFVVKNSTDGPAEETGVKENIGLSNLRRQLELLYSDFEFTVLHNGSVFTAHLNINLASHV